MFINGMPQLINLGTIRFTASSLLRCCKIWNQERIRMINNLMYIDLKMGYSDDDPAWIGYVVTVQGLAGLEKTDGVD